MLKQVTMAATGLVLGLSMTAQAGTLEDVQKRGSVSCGVSTGLAGFSQKDEKGKWSGIDVDVCRAVAAAVLGDADKVQYKPLTAKERFTALQSGEVDMLSRNTTWTLTRDVSLGLNFAGVNYYDGQGFMVSKSLGVSSVNDLDGAAVCIQAGTTTELNLADYFRAHGMKYTAITFDTSDQTRSGFESGRCDVLTSDQSQLYALRIGLKKPSSAMVLPEVISKEPLGPVVRQGDDAWFNVVKWSLAALIEAEFLNVTSSTASKLAKSGTPEQQRLLGNTGDAGSKLGLDAKWAYNIVSQVGNYSEVFERNVGSGSPLKIARGLNAQWNKGGIMYSNPIR
ncbi:amino acid ABC transporter substrate-binding protein [Oceanobacter sp. 4_MG-2023]|uniref:amino acid ABC transporter substrate-binding protein n=1 Tax=Oceanobacter sp. 4_MG-2023 TaxID=3062623 RepID=UPI002732C8D2|nr:amino acid ABC transporter substrate-binding protein [Oceanobacter sp. 4_MG-2023]MDP2548452.1 amino acid ABC transporter substrate-binding protein [Oceanobacter sp. 4_MG-2023]